MLSDLLSNLAFLTGLGLMALVEIAAMCWLVRANRRIDRKRREA